MHPVLFYGQDYEKQNGSGLVISLSLVCKTCLEKFGVWVIPKIAFANLCIPIHDIIIPISYKPFNLKTGEEGQKLQKI